MEAIVTLDHQILTYLASHVRCDALTALARVLTFLGDHGTIWIVLGLLLLLRPKTRRWGVALLAALAVCAALSEFGFKFLVQRERPFLQYPELVPLIPPPSGYSFPSSHTATGFACATVLFCMKKPAGLAAYALAALIGLSRLYVCVHVPSDVAAGVILGLAVGLVVTALVRRAADAIHYSRLR